MGSNYLLKIGDEALFVYDTTQARWISNNNWETRFLRKDERDIISISQGSSLGVLALQNLLGSAFVLDILNNVGTRVAYIKGDGEFGGTGRLNMISTSQHFLQGAGLNAGNGVVTARSTNGGIARVFLAEDNAGTDVAYIMANGTIFHARSDSSDRSIRRDEKCLNTPENVVTAGAINNQAITAGIFNQRFTLATSITGHANGESGRELTINNANTVSCDLVYESASSTAANRYYFATLANLTIPSRGIVTLIYNSTISRWELKNKNF